MIVPPPLTHQSRIVVIAPSGPFEETQLRAGLARLPQFSYVMGETLSRRRSGFLAGTDEERLLELQAALDGDESAVLVARGGYGLARLLPHLDFAQFARAPKWIIGFSDVTSLLARAYAEGVCSLHAPNGTTLAQVSNTDVETLGLLLGGNAAPPIDGLECWTAGSCTGPLFGGNLTVLFAEAASGRLAVPPGAILFIEDVTETSYRVDRMLTALQAGGHFDGLSGVVVGEFQDCSPGRFEVRVDEVLRERLGRLGVPVAAGLPVGHGLSNRPLVFGGRAQLDAAQGRLAFS